MSDNQRRVYCRIMFLVICAFPTAFVGYWICHPQTASGWERTLQANLGVITTIDSIETPRPYVTVLRGLEFSDPEIGTLFKAVEAKIEFGKNNNIISIPYRVQGLTDKGVAYLLKKIDENLLRAHSVDKPWKIQFVEDTVISQDLAINAVDLLARESLPQFQMAEFHVHVSPHAGGTLADISFKVPMSNVPENLVRCSLERTEEYPHLLMLETNSVALPCWLVSGVVPYVPSSFGTAAQFVGLIEVVPIPGETQVAIDGTFDQVDLERSISILPGEQRYGRIEMDKFHFRNSEVKSGEGWIHQGSGPGMRINPSSMFSFKRQVAPLQAIRETFLQRHANQVDDQYKLR